MSTSPRREADRLAAVRRLEACIAKLEATELRDARTLHRVDAVAAWYDEDARLWRLAAAQHKSNGNAHPAAIAAGYAQISANTATRIRTALKEPTK